MQAIAVPFSIHAQDFIFGAVENICSGKGKKQGDVEISQSNDHEFNDYQSKAVSFTM
jgi:hypothetical protein